MAGRRTSRVILRRGFALQCFHSFGFCETGVPGCTKNANMGIHYAHMCKEANTLQGCAHGGRRWLGLATTRNCPTSICSLPTTTTYQQQCICSKIAASHQSYAHNLVFTGDHIVHYLEINLCMHTMCTYTYKYMRWICMTVE